MEKTELVKEPGNLANGWFWYCHFCGNGITTDDYCHKLDNNCNRVMCERCFTEHYLAGGLVE